MRSSCLTWTPVNGWRGDESDAVARVDLILAFGSGEALEEGSALRALQDAHEGALIAAVSTAGEIAGHSVSDGSIAALLLSFDATTVRGVQVAIGDGESSDAIAARLVASIPLAGLSHLFLFSDGLHVNGSALAAGVSAALPPQVAVTGGLAGDGDRFRETRVGLGTEIRPRQVVAIALYGSALRVGYGSVGGWDAFGPERLITRSHGNVLHSLDDEPALALYKRYLGDAAAGLPASALLFPLALLRGDGTPALVRTILAVNEDAGTMTFAGDVPEGAYVRLMRANFDRLVDGAQQAATDARLQMGAGASAAILVSCVGRRLVLKQRVEDELDGVRRVLGPAVTMAGFYSYGEITPVQATGRCELHNQTMTVTILAEG